jgi:hypothetical protein
MGGLQGVQPSTVSYDTFLVIKTCNFDACMLGSQEYGVSWLSHLCGHHATCADHGVLNYTASATNVLWAARLVQRHQQRKGSNLAYWP